MNILRRPFFQASILFVIALSVFLSLQALTPNIIDGDGYYHIRLAQMMRDDFIIDTLPQGNFTIFQKSFSDKDFLFHVYLLPFTGGDLNFGAKLATAVLDAGLIVALFFILQSYGISWAFFALFGLGALSARFWFVLLTPRPHLLSLMLVLLAVWSLEKNKKRWLFLASLFETLSYTAWHLIPGLSLIFVFLKGFKKRDFDGHLFFASGLGALLGLVLHPHPLTHLKIWSLQNLVFYLHLFGLRSPLPAGQEMMGLSLVDLWFSFPMELSMMMIAFGIWYRSRGSWIAWGWLAVVFMIMTMGTIKFCHYWSPTCFVFFVLAIHQLFHAIIPPRRLILAFIGFILCLTVAWQTQKNFLRFQDLKQMPPVYLASEINALNQFVPQEAFVFNCDWLSTVVLFFYRPDLRFPIILDPIFAYYGQRDKTEIWLKACSQKTDFDPAGLMATIKPQYFFLNRHDQVLVQQLQETGSATLLWRNQRVILLKSTDLRE